MDWFEKLTGVRERDWAKSRAGLNVEGDQLRSTFNGRSFGVGSLQLPSLNGLREEAANGSHATGRLRVSLRSGDVRAMHRLPEFAGALFQVASQFNMLEMMSPDRTPEYGVTCYDGDPTQGPACAIAAGAATIYRNYFAPVDGIPGQTAARQLDGLSEIGDALSQAMGRPVSTLWTMRNGYALSSQEALDAISRYLTTLSAEAVDQLRGHLRIGLHQDVEVTDGMQGAGPKVSQAFCSALPVAYSAVASVHWAPFATLVLEAAYEATLLAAALNASRGASNIVLLTRLGGGAFGNADAWIHGAIQRALQKVASLDLRVVLVSHGAPSPALLQMANDFA